MKYLKLKAGIIISLIILGTAFNLFIPTQMIGVVLISIAGIITILCILNDIKNGTI